MNCSEQSEVKWNEVAQSCLTLCNPVDCSLPGSSVHGILQARIVEWIAISFSRRSSPPRDRTQVSRIGGRRFKLWATREADQGKNNIQCSSHTPSKNLSPADPGELKLTGLNFSSKIYPLTKRQKSKQHWENNSTFSSKQNESRYFAETLCTWSRVYCSQVTLSQKRKADRVLQRPTWKQVRQIISLPSSNFHTAEINLLVAHKHSKASWKLRLSQGYSGWNWREIQNN